MALPNTNISTSLVGQTIDSGSRDVGTLCTHPNINKWSKWKPVRWNKVDDITLANLEAINYGIAYNSYANTGAIKTAYEANEEVMAYAKPRGSLYNEPYRLGDFRNYEHSSIQPIAGALVTRQVQNIANEQTSIVGSIFANGSPKTYIKDGKQSIGFIAQEVQELYPELVLVGEDDNHYLSLNYGSITSVLSAQVNTIEDEVTILKNKIRDLEYEITILKNK